MSGKMQHADYAESVKQVWKNCETILEGLSLEKQASLEIIIEELSQLKYEKISDIKGKHDLILKRLKLSGLPVKYEAQRQQRDQEIERVVKEVEELKRTKLRELSLEFDKRKKQLLSQHIEETFAGEKRLNS
jgi:hypothetical protein